MYKEKSISSSTNRKLPWKQNGYLETRLEKLAPTVAKLKCEKPEMHRMSITGCRFLSKPRKKFRRIPVITISGPDEIEENLSNSSYDPDDVNILKIQDCEIISDKFILPTASGEEECEEYNPIVFNLIFEAIDVHQQVEQKIILENKGVFAITYSWCNNTAVKPIIGFSHEGNRIETFKFNKDVDIILPGQIVILSVWYNPPQEDVGSESVEVWELDTEPKISSSPVIFNFRGFCVSSTVSDYTNEWSISDESIYEGINESIDDEYLTIYFYEFIREIIADLLDNVVVVNHPSQSNKINFINIDTFLRKNPGYHYHSDIVEELKQMYNEVTENSCSSRELSLDKLHNILLTKDDVNEKNIMLKKFHALCRESLKPSFYVPVMNIKYDTTYNMLCAFVNKFEDESELVKRHCYTGNPVSQLELEHLNNGVIPSISIMSQSSQAPVIKTERKFKKRQLSKSSDSSTASSIKTSSRRKDENLFTHKDNITATNPTEKTIDLPIYLEILSARIHVLLNNTIIQICAVIDSIKDDNQY